MKGDPMKHLTKTLALLLVALLLLPGCVSQYANKVVIANYDRLYELLYKEVYTELVPQEKPLRVQDLDFDHRDTADWSSFGNYDRKPRVCTPEGCF